MSIGPDGSVRQSITVAASPEHAFRLFTADFDSWWPRSHHIGQSPMTRAVIEGVVGGRCYSAQEDGTDCPWGHVLAWDPPHRLVLAWQVTHDWKFEPEIARASEVEVRFTDIGGGSTRVDLEHRHFERMGPHSDVVRQAVDSPGGWGSLLELYGQRTAAATEAASAR